MTARGFSWSSARDGIPNVRHYPVKAGETFKEGEWVTLDSAGLLVAATAGAGALTLVGLSGAAAFQGRGYELANSSLIQQVTGRDSFLPVYLSVGNIFVCRGVNGGTDPVTPADTNVDEQYGLALSSNVWYLDISNTTDKAVEIVKVDIDNKLFFVSVIGTVAQIPI